MIMRPGRAGVLITVQSYSVMTRCPFFSSRFSAQVRGLRPSPHLPAVRGKNVQKGRLSSKATTKCFSVCPLIAFLIVIMCHHVQSVWPLRKEEDAPWLWFKSEVKKVTLDYWGILDDFGWNRCEPGGAWLVRVRTLCAPPALRAAASTALAAGPCEILGAGASLPSSDRW